MVANQQPQITPLPEVERIVRENGPRILSQMTDVLRQAWGLNPELTEYEVKTAEIIPLSRIPLAKDVKGAEDLSKVLQENNIFGYVVPALQVSVPLWALTNHCTFSVTLGNDGIRFGATCSSTG